MLPEAYAPTAEEAREHLRQWARAKRRIFEMTDQELTGSWLPIAVEAVLAELERREALNEGMVLEAEC